MVTLELVPGRESKGRNTDTLKGIARDAFADGRISAVSITDNPGGNPSLSPDVLGSEIFAYGLDVIVHFTWAGTTRKKNSTLSGFQEQDVDRIRNIGVCI